MAEHSVDCLVVSLAEMMAESLEYKLAVKMGAWMVEQKAVKKVVESVYAKAEWTGHVMVETWVALRAELKVEMLGHLLATQKVEWTECCLVEK